MDYKKLETEINKTLNFKLTDENMSRLISVVQTEHEANVRMLVHGKELNKNKFEELTRPVIKYLCENYHPHVTVIITPTSAELLGGLKTIGRIEDYIRD